MSEQKQEMPRLVWLHPWIEARMFSLEQQPEHLPYVPESELARVRRETWEAAILVAQGWATSPSCNEVHTDNPCCHVRTGAGIAAALEQARDESEGQDE